MESIEELIEQLNATDECADIEAKRGAEIDRSVMETVCAFSNEPGMEGGYILLGVERDESTMFPSYTVTGVGNPDKLQLDLSTQCANNFNLSVRPEIEAEQLNNGSICLKVFIPELPAGQKPLYFKNRGLPGGAYRRIGSSDQRCTDDDLHVFYNTEDSLDSSIIKNTTLEDISEEAVSLYRKFREKVNPLAEELSYEDNELLQSLGCIKKVNNGWLLTYTGLLVFGKRQSLRRLLPMVRVDYIRVPGNTWVHDPDNRFTTVDMRGPLIELVQRTFNSITDDLPKGFLLADNEIQAESVGLPAKVLREAIVNAFIHRTYRENQPIQIIRYGNRIEIKNPGFSLKPEDQLGEPGSKNRNPFIAAIFHETNLAETKGSGIRTMRKLMEKAKMAPPTFESDHTGNQFTIRLLLHHFLNENDIAWLQGFQAFELNDAQKRSLIFIREVGAIDNSIYRQLNGCDSLKATSELRGMRESNILLQKGKGKATYYIPDVNFKSLPDPGILSDNPDGLSDHLGSVKSDYLSSAKPDYLGSAKPDHLKSLSGNPGALSGNPGALSGNLGALSGELPSHLLQQIKELGKRALDKEKLDNVILNLCSWKPLTLKELAILVQRNEKYLSNIVSPLREKGKLAYTIPEMPNHPDQAYKTVENPEQEKNHANKV